MLATNYSLNLQTESQLAHQRVKILAEIEQIHFKLKANLYTLELLLANIHK